VEKCNRGVVVVVVVVVVGCMEVSRNGCQRWGVSSNRIYLPQLEHEQSEPQLPVEKEDVSIRFYHSLLLCSSSRIFPFNIKPVDDDRMVGLQRWGKEGEGSLTAGGT
jgi:hypothetical protein